MKKTEHTEHIEHTKNTKKKKYCITSFGTNNVPNSSSKVPLSPFYTKEKPQDANLFLFKNNWCYLENIHICFQNDYILSRPLNISNKSGFLKTFRNGASLNKYYNQNPGYILLDIDNVYSQESLKYIISYFKINDYPVNLFNSRTFNSENGKYNLKAILGVSPELPITQAVYSYILNTIQKHLKGHCVIDFSIIRASSYQATIPHTTCFLYSEGSRYIEVPSNIINQQDNTCDLLTSNKFEIEKDSAIEEKMFVWCKNYFIEHHGVIFKNKENPNGSINASINSEVNSKFSYFLYKNVPYILQHPDSSKNINILNQMLKSPVGKEFLIEQHNKVLNKTFNLKQKIKNSYFKNYVCFNERYFPKIIDQASKNSGKKDINKLLLEVSREKSKYLLGIKGAMGTGKSNIIEHFVKNNNRILLISMRKTLSYDIYDKYNKYGLKHYIEDIEQYIPGQNLVIQFDSLYKIKDKVKDYFDVVIIDEFESFLLYIKSPFNTDNYNINIQITRYLFNNKSMIISDAFLNNKSFELFQDSNTKFSRYMIENLYKDSLEVSKYSNKFEFFRVLLETIENKETEQVITCSFGTLSELKDLNRLLISKGIKTFIVTGETEDYIKTKLSSVFKKDESIYYDVLLYSPTITVGVSILHNVPIHFHYDIGKSVDPISSIQMLKRSRNAKAINTYIKGINKFPQSTDAEYLNQQVKLRASKVLFDNDHNIMYNPDTNQLTDIGIFINKIRAHSNLYINNHLQSTNILLGIQFSNIVENNNIYDKQLLDNKTIEPPFKKMYLSQYKDLEKQYVSFSKNYLHNKERKTKFDKIVLYVIDNLDLDREGYLEILTLIKMGEIDLKIIEFINIYVFKTLEQINNLVVLFLESHPNFIISGTPEEQEHYNTLLFLKTLKNSHNFGTSGSSSLKKKIVAKDISQLHKQFCEDLGVEKSKYNMYSPIKYLRKLGYYEYNNGMLFNTIYNKYIGVWGLGYKT